ncbi:hypothetical protein DL764_006021 [Monosporascus ibericus]|uniref:Uncharacterized protein n=1 Tax=Monosporascus ibericus TaxID=155417 RepID=A0A4Q4T6C7_9PEZI|nr:hypothetical protein DL764_006021 [Monosporascus ibericus]
MPFGSSQPTQTTKTTLRSSWDCGQSHHAIQKLAASWLEGNKTTTLSKNTRLSSADEQIIQGIMSMDEPAVTKQLVKTLQFSLNQFEKVRSQLLSLLLAWEHIMLEKKRYDEEGFDVGKSDSYTISPTQYLILFRIICSHSQVGLLSLRKSEQSPPWAAGVKRSIESPSPELQGQPDTKKVKADKPVEKRNFESTSPEAEGQPDTKKAKADKPVEKRNVESPSPEPEGQPDTKKVKIEPVE